MIVFKNATLLEFDPPRIREGQDVSVEGDTIVDVGPDLPTEGADRVIDVIGRLLFPGMVNSHTHYYSALARGIIANIGPTPDFVSILKNLWWRLDQAIDNDILYYSGLVGSLDAVRSGTTAVIDHNASANVIEGSLSTLKKGYELAGLRGAVCYEVTDRYGEESMHAGIAENVAFARSLDDGKDAPRLVEAFIGGHAPCTIPDAAMKRLADACDTTGRGFHIHLAEDRWDVSHSHITYGQDLISRLDSFGLVNDRSLLVHGVFLNDDEVDRINSRDAFLVHNCRSNMNNGVGYNLRLPRLKNLALGTDGIGEDMFAEMKTAYFKHKDAQGELFPSDFLRALAAGNRVLERIFPQSFGRIEKGYAADLVVGRYDTPTPLVPENIAGHMVFGMGSEIVETVMIAGRIVLEDRKFPMDVAEIYAAAREQAQRLWSRMDAANT